MPKPLKIDVGELKPRSEREVRTADKVRPVGVALRESEIDRLDELAEHLGVSRSHLMGFFVRYGMRELEAGRLEPGTKESVHVQLQLPTA